jgi:hypothetical protein
MKVKDLPGTPCVICHEIIPPTHARIVCPYVGDMCCSHEGERIEVWELNMGGAICIYRKKDEASEDIKEFKANGDKYRFRKIKMKCSEVLSLGEFVGW